ncbi:MAG: ROK family protein [Candidatus Saelkia tenebricola]|nr:ROK family protein [Candidatus Saelkia tenebricola]
MNKHYLGIDFGGTNFKFGVVDSEFNLKEFKIMSLGKLKDPRVSIVFIKDLVSDLSKKYKLMSIGFGLPGPVDFETGHIHYLVNLKNWRNIGWKKLMEQELKIPVFLDNDVNAATLAEYYLGSGRGCLNMMMVALGTGVGGGLILGGKIYRGASNVTAEIGHIPLSIKGPKCNCKGIACLESYIGNQNLLNYAYRILHKHPESVLSAVKKKKLIISLEDITDAAKAGDKFAIDFWNDVAEKLGQALVGVVNILNIEKIVIGGGVSAAGQFLFKPLRKFVRVRAMDIQAKNVKIVKAKFQNKAGIIGSALIAKYALEKRSF